MANFFVESERRKEWFNCLVALDNWMSNHSVAIKTYKMNNPKGIHRIISELINNLDSFVDCQEDLEITIKPAGDKKK